MAVHSDGTPPTDAQDVFDELYTALASHHSGHHIDEMARCLLRVDHERELVALVDDASQAVVYHARAHVLAAHSFDQYEFVKEPDEILRQRLSHPAAWLDATPDRPDWIHPRYRWLLDLLPEHTH